MGWYLDCKLRNKIECAVTWVVLSLSDCVHSENQSKLTDGDQRANPLTERTEKASLGGKYGGRGVYEALSVCGQYYDSVMVGGGLHSWNK